MAERTELIRKIDFFGELEDAIVEKIAESLVERRYSGGEYVTKQGQAGPGLHWIASGNVKVEVVRNGTRTVVAHLKESDFFGELSILDDKPRLADAVCTQDTRCLLLTRESFAGLLDEHPQIAVQVARALAKRLRRTTEQMAESAEEAADQLETGSEADAHGLASSSHDSSTKDQIKDFLVGAFSRFYTMKAFTRFSVAVVGCPVVVDLPEGGTESICTSIGEVQVSVFPSRLPRRIRVRALGEGNFSAAVLRPGAGGVTVDRFDCRVEARDLLFLCVPERVGSPVLLERGSATGSPL